MGVPVEVIVCSVVTPNHVFIQQPTHPTFPSLERQSYHMRMCYNVENVPHLPRPIDGKVSAVGFPEEKIACFLLQLKIPISNVIIVNEN